VIDAGCGTGRVTAKLLERLPRGRVIAVDISRQMLATARETLSGHADQVTFLEKDLADLDLDGVADAVFSTATFHWIPDHDALFRSLFRSLKGGGALEAQCSGEGNLSHFRKLAGRLLLEEPFKPFFVGWQEPWHSEGPDETRRRLLAAGFQDVETWLEPAPTSFNSADDYSAFVRTVVGRSYLQQIGDQQTGNLLIDRLTQAASRDDAGFSLDYVRLNLRAISSRA
jgi:trans-aconitate 2-methyltransferase